ncbi:unnamed protein product [Mytilus coruscus]|uniref:Uncharacterized protein n=1 Tax=Mytilus coruscus TaxID=42192 RepID=A0A6J8APP8_MYTCO|nr:unnamed protein product [Mytilus coruscus]
MANLAILYKLLVLEEGHLAQNNILDYLSYATRTYQLFLFHDVTSVFFYDREYRRLQYLHKFRWGTDVPHIQTVFLKSKGSNSNKFSKPPVSTSKGFKPSIFNGYTDLWTLYWIHRSLLDKQISGLFTGYTDLWTIHWIYRPLDSSLDIQRSGLFIRYTDLWTLYWIYRHLDYSLDIQSSGLFTGYTGHWTLHWIYRSLGSSLDIQISGLFTGYTDLWALTGYTDLWTIHCIYRPVDYSLDIQTSGLCTGYTGLSARHRSRF